MNWHHWYWWTLPAGAAIGVVIVCVVNYVVSEIGRRRMMAQIHAARDAAASRHEMSRKTNRPYPGGAGGNAQASTPCPGGNGGMGNLNPFGPIAAHLRGLPVGWPEEDEPEETDHA